MANTNTATAGEVVTVQYQKRGNTFGVYAVPSNGWPRLLEGGLTREAAETRALELTEGGR